MFFNFKFDKADHCRQFMANGLSADDSFLSGGQHFAIRGWAQRIIRHNGIGISTVGISDSKNLFRILVAYYKF
jgi:hypothetical protein